MQVKKENWLGGMAVLAALFASACCITPAIAFLLGIWLLPIALLGFFESLRPYLLFGSFLILGLAVYFNQKNASCCSIEERRRSNVRFGIIAILVLLAASSPYWIQWVYQLRR